MHTLKHLALLLLCSASGAAFANGKYPVTAVVLYSGSATVERTASVTPGMTQLEIKGIPANFKINTIRVQADPGIQIGQFVTKDTGTTDVINAREAEIEAKIQALKDQRTALDVDAKSAELVQHYLEHLVTQAGQGADKAQAYDAKALATVIDTIRHGAADSFDRMQKVEIQKRVIGKSIDALKHDLEQVESGVKALRDITISLVVQDAGSVRVSYQVDGPGWEPGYRAALNSAASSMELDRMATIAQNTGEDWNGVTLKLSTGQPRLSPAAPEPSPWLLGYHKSREALARAAAPETRGLAEQRVEITGSNIRNEQLMPQIQSTFATEFEAPGRVTLPADGRRISVALSKQVLPVKQHIQVVPRVEKTAIVVAETPRPEGVWLDGKVQLYRDGNYVGSTSWDPQASEAFSFSFGRDDLVRVSANRTEQVTGSSGLLSRHGDRRVGDVFTLTSFHKAPVNVLVLESAPTSTSDEIKVQATFAPKPTIDNWKKLQGVVGWEKTLAPNETMKISVDYDIAYPEEGAVSGLP